MKKSIFTQIQAKKPPRSVFDLSHQVTMPANYGILYPCLVMDMVPGDVFNISCEALVRLQPLVTPMMSRVDVYVHYFFVPNRLVWPGWEDYITQQPYDGVPPAHPYFNLDSDLDSMFGGLATYYLSYYGLPNMNYPAAPNGIKCNALPFACFNKIYNDWYRDQNLVDEIPYELSDGDNDAMREDLLNQRWRAWEHDYLTSALPFAQKGPAVSIPLGNITLKQPWETASVHPRFVAGDGDPDNGALAQAADLLDPTTSNITIGGNPKYAYNPDGTLQVAPTTINDLRRAYRLQEWYEKQARGGTRYIEVILSHFGIRSSDARLQRPEYITGARTPVSISEVLQTSSTEGTSPQGNLAGHGIAGLSGNYGRYFAEEHGWIIGVLSIRPKPLYWQGIPKRFLKVNDAFEYYWPEFANIGEQAILNAEVNAEHSNPAGTFGYIPRYAEYKFENNRAAGAFQGTGNLKQWVSLRTLPPDVALNQDFIECHPNYDNFAVTEPLEEHFLVNIYHNIRAVRPMPYYGTPTI